MVLSIWTTPAKFLCWMRSRFCLRTPKICCRFEALQVPFQSQTPPICYGSPIDTSAEVEEVCFPIQQRPRTAAYTVTIELGASAMTSPSFHQGSIVSRCFSPNHGLANTIGGTEGPAA